MIKKKKLIIFGASAFAEIAYEYFTHDSEYEVIAFTVNREFIEKSSLFSLPILPFEEIQNTHSPELYEMHIALVYNKLNRIRRQKYTEAKNKGYKLANYVSSSAFVWKNVQMGDNMFIFEDNTVQPFVEMNSNIVLWSGNHIGHHSTISSHCFISSHVVISGFVNIGECCFLGVNSTFANNINIGNDSLIGAGCLIVKSLPNGSLVYGPRNKPSETSTYNKFDLQ